jgi:hypothetical protein
MKATIEYIVLLIIELLPNEFTVNETRNLSISSFLLIFISVIKLKELIYTPKPNEKMNLFWDFYGIEYVWSKVKNDFVVNEMRRQAIQKLYELIVYRFGRMVANIAITASIEECKHLRRKTYFAVLSNKNPEIEQLRKTNPERIEDATNIIRGAGDILPKIKTFIELTARDDGRYPIKAFGHAGLSINNLPTLLDGRYWYDWDFGGDPWKQIAVAGLQLKKALDNYDISKATIYLDHVLDLEHHSGNLLGIPKTDLDRKSRDHPIKFSSSMSPVIARLVMAVK